MGACFAIPYTFILRWLRLHGEHKFRMLMRSRGRLITWPDLLRAMHETGGTCIEERFSPKGPVRFWWTREDVHRESPHEIIDWFTMRKGRRCEQFVHWCRERYTSAEAGSAVLVDTPLVPKREIYALWSECRSDAMTAELIEWRRRRFCRGGRGSNEQNILDQIDRLRCFLRKKRVMLCQSGTDGRCLAPGLRLAGC